MMKENSLDRSKLEWRGRKFDPGSSILAFTRKAIVTMAPSNDIYTPKSQSRSGFGCKFFLCGGFSQNNDAPKIKKSKTDNPVADGQEHLQQSSTAKSEIKENLPQINLPKLCVKEIIDKTENFAPHHLIGEGKCGGVYLVVLDGGIKIAIKKLNSLSGNGFSVQETADFLVQLSRVLELQKHENIVHLLGYYVDCDNHLLSYEYANSTLHTALHDSENKLEWEQRMRIAMDAAKGLDFLHQKKVLHHNIKSGNILLFDDFKAKVDFNIRNQPPDMDTHLNSMRVLGTFGYHAPEYSIGDYLSVKSDVYSFGVVLLEILTGRKPIDRTMPKGEHSLVTWAIPKLMENEVESCIDPGLGGRYKLEEVVKYAALTQLCLQFEPDLRPTMDVVAKTLGVLAGFKDQ